MRAVATTLLLVGFGVGCEITSTIETRADGVHGDEPQALSRTAQSRSPERIAEGGEPPLWPTLMRARSASVMLRFGTRGRCSATKIGQRLLLTAAHCLVGYGGDEDRGPLFFERDGRSYALDVVEMGAFAPREGKMQDWLLLAPRPGEDAFVGLRSVDLASPSEVASLRSRVADALDDHAVAIWSVTYPAPSYRAYPRTPLLGGQLASHGFLKSDAAYRKSTVVALAQRFIYDDRAPGGSPTVPPDYENRWRYESDLPVRDMYQRYEAAGDPILYHSADYAPGSSGGGLFAQDTGKLLGVVPFGTSMISRLSAYPGFGAMYGIDAICREAQSLECPA